MLASSLSAREAQPRHEHVAARARQSRVTASLAQVGDERPAVQERGKAESSAHGGRGMGGAYRGAELALLGAAFGHRELARRAWGCRKDATREDWNHRDQP